MISSMVLDLARIERMRRCDMVKVIMITTRSVALVVTLHRITGAKRSIVITNKSNAFATRLINGPE